MEKEYLFVFNEMRKKLDKIAEKNGNKIYLNGINNFKTKKIDSYVEKNYGGKFFSQKDIIDIVAKYVKDGYLRSNRLASLIDVFEKGFVSNDTIKGIFYGTNGGDVLTGFARTYFDIIDKFKDNHVLKKFKLYEISNPFVFREASTIIKSRTIDKENKNNENVNQSFLLPSDSKYVGLDSYSHDNYALQTKFNMAFKWGFNFLVGRDNICAIHDNIGDDNYIVIYIPNMEVIKTIDEVISNDYMNDDQAKILTKYKK